MFKSTEVGFREIEGSIKVTDGKLYIVNYDSLTMAAQFEDALLPDKNAQDNKIDLENGIYNIRIVQLKDSKAGEGGFILEIEPTKKEHAAWIAVPWSTIK